MSRIVYVNGRYLPRAIACVDVEDRGYQFADGVYEVCEIANGAMIDVTPHLDRLDRSLRSGQRVEHCPFLAKNDGATDAHRRTDGRKGVAAMMPGIGYHRF